MGVTFEELRKAPVGTVFEINSPEYPPFAAVGAGLIAFSATPEGAQIALRKALAERMAKAGDGPA